MADFTVVVSEGSFKQSFDLLKRNFKFEYFDSNDYGDYSVTYDLLGHLEGGSVDFRDDNTVQVKELDFRWKRFVITLQVDLPQVCIGGGCINIPAPFPDVCLPPVCLFSNSPDISVTLDVAPYVVQELSLTGSIATNYWDPMFVPNAFIPCSDQHEILSNQGDFELFPSDSKQWHVFIDPETIDIDLFDFPDVVGNLLMDELNTASQSLLTIGIIDNLALQVYGDIIELIRFILDIPDDIEEWLSDRFNTSFGLINDQAIKVFEFFGSCVPIYRLDDPFKLLGKTEGLIPVNIPINDLDVRVDDVEMIIEVEIGA